MTAQTRFSTGPTTHIRTIDTENVILLIDPASYRVVQVAFDHPHLRQPLLDSHPGAVAIGGDLAQSLYEAIAGRHYHEPPEAASRGRAFRSRWRLANMACDGVADLVAGAVGHYGLFKWDPWLGTTGLTEERGRIKGADYG